MGNRVVTPVFPAGRQTTERQTVQKYSLDALAREHLEKATGGATGRSATAVYGGHEQVLRQTLVALRASTWLSEHENPGEATLFVLRGRVRLHAGPDTSEGWGGDLLIIPPTRHSLEALEDSVVLLTVAK
jgi:quercetin dioxygenase-like cupin family protein